MGALLRRIRTRVPNVALGVIIGLLVGGGAFAIAQTTSDGVHGGPRPRFHDASECKLVDIGALPGNWTHGDYVSAVAKKDPSKVREAAKSRCGKPTHAGKGRGKGPKAEDGSQGKPAAKPSKTPKPSPKPSGSPTPSPTGTASVGPTADASPSPSATASASS